MSKVRGISIDYYEVWAYINDGTGKYNETKYDIAEIFELLSESDCTQRTFEYKEEKVRVQEVKYDKQNEIWEIQLLRAREYIQPGVADDTGNYDILDLGEDKYYAESISLLYDSKRCIIGMQINHNYITRTILEQIFNSFYNDDQEGMIQLRPIITSDGKEKIKKAEYCTRIAVVLKDPKMKEKEYDNKTLLGQLFNSSKKFNGIQCKIEIGFGKNLKKKDSLSMEEVKSMIDTVDKIKGIEELELDYKDMEDSTIDKVSLIKERIQDAITVTVEKGKSISHAEIFQKMKEKYLHRIKHEMI